MLRKTTLAAVLIASVLICCSRSDDDWIRDLDSDRPRTRRLAFSRLVMHGNNPETVGKLIGLLKSDNDRLVFIVTQILGSIADTSAVHPLGSIIEHPDPSIRERAAESLGLIGHKSAAPYLIEALEDSVPGVRRTAVKMLGRLNHAPATKYIVKMLKDDLDSVRVEAVQALYMYRESKEAGVMAADFKETLYDYSERVRYVTVQALGYGYPDSTAACYMLIGALKDRSKYVRVEAILSLEKIRCARAIPHFKKMHDLATYQEQIAISEAIKNMTGEDFPAFRAKLQN